MAATEKLTTRLTGTVSRCRRHEEVVEKDGKGKGYTGCATKSVKVLPEKCCEMRATGESLDGWLGPRNSLEPKAGGSLSSG